MRGVLIGGLRGAFLVGVLAGLGAAPAAGGLPEVGKMTVGELLAEFHGGVEMVVPAPQRRVDVINGLRRAGVPLIEMLRKEMGDGDAAVRRRAVIVAAYLGVGARPLVLELMTAAEKEKEGFVREMALSILCRLREPCALDLILRAAHDPAAGVRGVVVRDGEPALADAPFAVAVLALKDADVNVRAMAVRNLMMMKDKRAVGYLLPVLEDEVVMNYDVREGVKTASRPCDEAARALEFLVDGAYLVGDGKTQAEHDARVAQWRAWGKEKGAGFDAALYVEPEMVRARE